MRLSARLLIASCFALCLAVPAQAQTAGGGVLTVKPAPGPMAFAVITQTPGTVHLDLFDAAGYHSYSFDKASVNSVVFDGKATSFNELLVMADVDFKASAAGFYNVFANYGRGHGDVSGGPPFSTTVDYKRASDTFTSGGGTNYVEPF